jgi:SAM-dependent methyltransferase
MAGGEPGLSDRTALPGVVQTTDGMLARARTSLQLRALDLTDRLTGRRDRLTPPRRMSQYVGHGDFAAVGDEFLALMRAQAGLASSDRVLDIGCGIGRMARVLTAVLEPPGSYDGFDVTRSGIEWCQRRYGRQRAPFRFTHVDLANDTYNPSGQATASSFRFPSDARAFDLVIATSVFTHLLPDETANYLSEIGRVLAPGGRLFSTWFVVDGDGAPPPPFEHGSRSGAALVADATSPSAAVAYGLDHLTDAFGRSGLTMEPVRRGSWQIPGGASLQDIIVARRR